MDVRTSQGDGWELAWSGPRSAGGPVRYYAGFAEELDQPRRSVEPATVSARLVIVFGDTMTVTTSRPSTARHVGAFVAGPRATPAVVDQQGSLRGVEVGLTLGAAACLLGTELGDLGEGVVPLGDVIGRRASEIHDRLAVASGWADVFETVDCYLRPTAGLPVDPRLRWAWETIERSKGRVRIGLLAEKTGWSRRHLGARFRSTFGVTPKVAARLFRFEHATRLLQSGLAPAGVAVRCGYFDQAHMHLDFSSFGTSTPGEIAARCSTDSLASAWSLEDA